MIIFEAALSFLGLGVPRPLSSLETILAESQPYLYNAWWLPVSPSIAMSLLVMASHLTGDGLRDRIDPIRRQLCGYTYQPKRVVWYVLSQSVRGAVALPIQGKGRKGGATMDYKQIVAARLAGVGVSVSDSELEQLTAAYTRLLTWETVVQGMVQPETEPALVFRAQEEG